MVSSLKGYMKTGIPEAGLPPLDPLNLDNVGFSLAGAHIEFRNVTMSGLSSHQLGEVTYNEQSRWADSGHPSSTPDCVHPVQTSGADPRRAQPPVQRHLLAQRHSSEY